MHYVALTPPSAITMHNMHGNTMQTLLTAELCMSID